MTVLQSWLKSKAIKFIFNVRGNAPPVIRSVYSLKAEEVLAKHDENYMPPEVAEMLAEQGHPIDSGTVESVAN